MAANVCKCIPNKQPRDHPSGWTRYLISGYGLCYTFLGYDIYNIIRLNQGRPLLSWIVLLFGSARILYNRTNHDSAHRNWSIYIPPQHRCQEKNTKFTFDALYHCSSPYIAWRWICSIAVGNWGSFWVFLWSFIFSKLSWSLAGASLAVHIMVSLRNLTTNLTNVAPQYSTILLHFVYVFCGNACSCPTLITCSIKLNARL